jgi:transcriptional regulator with PAS, ATPase and Fis domain
VAAGRFREDLYYRVNVLSIKLPPLRDRDGDIPILCKHFLGSSWKLGEGVLELFQAYDWPGNVRQLLNALERAKVLADSSGVISVDDLPPELLKDGRCRSTPVVGGTTDLDSLNRAHVLAILKQQNGNKARAARVLGINRRSLYRLLEKYGEAIHQDSQFTHS